MPLYEYQCEACGHRFEVIQKISDAPIAVCPSCGGAVHKLQSAPAFQFKGSGWYITDYARKDQKESAKSGTGSTDDSKTSGGKADKPAETPAKSSDSSPASTSTSAPTSTKSST
jgi:putative FmdB family regulatory protein